MIPLTDMQSHEVRIRIDEECRRMASLVRSLKETGETPAGGIHEIRKLGKSLRGAFAMIRLRKSAGRDVQAVTRMLSGSRDAAALLQTWRNLDWSADPAVAAAVDALLDRDARAAAQCPPDEAVEWCLARIDSAVAKLAAIDPAALESRATGGFTRLDRRARKRCRRLDRKAAGRFHEARKAIKAWLGAAAFLPQDLRPADPGYHGLAKLLGDENDLATLSRWLDHHGFTRRFAPDLRHRIEQERKDLQRKAVALGGGM